MNPPQHPIENDRIPDLVTEQEEAEILRDRDRVHERAQAAIAKALATTDEVEHALAAQADNQRNAARMAEEIATYLEVVAGNLDTHEAGRSADYVRRLAGYARQLEAHSLFETEYLTN